MADLESSESKDIIEVLNFREFVSVGINTGIIDEKVYKRAYCSVMIRDWKLLTLLWQFAKTSQSA